MYYFLNVPLSYAMLVINVVLFVFGCRTLKKTAVTKTLAGIVILSVFLEITAHFGAYAEDVLMAAIFGGILVGVGVGLTVAREASAGGSDFAALMLN